MQFASRIGAHQYRWLYRLARRWTAPGSDVLDWGAGNGHFAFALAEMGRLVTALALADEAPLFVRGPLAARGSAGRALSPPARSPRSSRSACSSTSRSRRRRAGEPR